MLLHALLCAYVGRVGSGSRALSLSLKECLSVFKPVQHAAQPSPLKLHTDAQQCPRGIPQAHAENLKKTKKHLGIKMLICIPAFFFTSAAAIKSSSSPLSSKISGGLFAQRASQFSPSISVSCIHPSVFLYLLPAIQWWCPVDLWGLVVLRT